MDAWTLDKKIELIQWLSALEDKNIIEKLIKFREAENKDWWIAISDPEKLSIEKGIEDADNNKLSSHAVARKLYERWL